MKQRTESIMITFPVILRSVRPINQPKSHSNRCVIPLAKMHRLGTNTGYDTRVFMKMRLPKAFNTSYIRTSTAFTGSSNLTLLASAAAVAHIRSHNPLLEHLRCIWIQVGPGSAKPSPLASAIRASKAACILQSWRRV